jgi:hypothetical protein
MFMQLLFAATLAITSMATVYAEGVSAIALIGDLDLAINATKEALIAANSHDSENCQTNIRRAKQHYKILVGDFSDMPSREDTMGRSLDKAMKRFKNTRSICAQENLADGTQAMEEVISLLERFRHSIRLE